MASFPIGKTVASLVAGVGTVCLGTALTEKTEDLSTFPPFQTSFTGSSCYDLSTFNGRFKSQLLNTSPFLLFNTEEELRSKKKIIDDLKTRFEKGEELEFDQQQNATLWRDQRIVNAAVHPDTSEIIPMPFRMSGYVPFNGPLAIGMMASSTTPGLLFFNWANQSQNAMINYYNRNASSEMSNGTLAFSYAGAVGSAMLVAYSLSTIVKRNVPNPSTATKLLRFVAFPSSVMASCLNCYIVRSPEIPPGVPLLSSTLTPLPLPPSSLAAKQGVYETVQSRAILQCPVFLIPPILISTIFKNALIRNPAMAVPVTTYLLCVCFGYGLPAANAIYPQISSMKREDVEEEFRDSIKEDRVYFNRGL
ncbi:hypothetical protein TrVE_jg2854 [Triparma verrucosa]|uniref:Sidoreflexin n=1 Tax=Triparma verrucosa TaxID=1606542 RepID=A0A9W7BPL4_9STRA|nr:hypothetical protein TrVE_jg2854 [Triparma verrucosa]